MGEENKKKITFRCCLYEIDLTTEVFILVEPAREGYGCDVVISDNGQRHIPPEATALEFRAAVLKAIEICKRMNLSIDHWFATRKAMVANMDEIPCDARRLLERFPSTDDYEGYAVIQVGAD